MHGNKLSNLGYTICQQVYLGAWFASEQIEINMALIRTGVRQRLQSLASEQYSNNLNSSDLPMWSSIGSI